MDIDWRAVVVGFVVVLVVGSLGGIALPSGIAGAIGGRGESL